MLYYKRNRPVVGLLQLPEGYPISFRFPSSYLRYGGGILYWGIKNRDGIYNETIPAKRKTVFCSGIIIEIMECFVKAFEDYSNGFLPFSFSESSISCF